MREVEIKEDRLNILDVILRLDLAGSKSEARRLIDHGGISIDSTHKADAQEEVSIKNGMVVRAGKHRFVRVRHN